MVWSASSRGRGVGSSVAGGRERMAGGSLQRLQGRTPFRGLGGAERAAVVVERDRTDGEQPGGACGEELRLWREYAGERFARAPGPDVVQELCDLRAPRRDVERGQRRARGEQRSGQVAFGLGQ